MSKKTRIGIKEIIVWRIEVDILENDEDWQFVFIDKGNGVKGMSVF